MHSQQMLNFKVILTRGVNFHWPHGSIRFDYDSSVNESNTHQFLIHLNSILSISILLYVATFSSINANSWINLNFLFITDFKDIMRGNSDFPAI